MIFHQSLRLYGFKTNHFCFAHVVCRCFMFFVVTMKTFNRIALGQTYICCMKYMLKMTIQNGNSLMAHAFLVITTIIAKITYRYCEKPKNTTLECSKATLRAVNSSTRTRKN